MKEETKVIVLNPDEEYLDSAMDVKEDLPIKPLAIKKYLVLNVTDDRIKAIQENVLAIKQELALERTTVEARVKEIADILRSEVITIAEVMEKFNVSRRSIYQRVSKSKLHNILSYQNKAGPGRSVLFLRAEVELYYKERQLHETMQNK